MKLQGKVYAVTGGGSGIGEAAVKRIIAEGGNVVIADVVDDQGRRVADEVTAAGGQAVFAHIDVSDENDARRMVEIAVETFGRFDGAVNNAGIGQAFKRLHELTTPEWDRLHSIDLRGVFFCMRAEIAHFLEHGGGVIVNTASNASLTAIPGQGGYVAAKHGVLGLTRQAALEYIKDGIRVVAVAPALVATPQFRSYPQETQDLYASMMPSGRAAQPEEIASVMAFLLSDDASFVSGDYLLVDGAEHQD